MSCVFQRDLNSILQYSICVCIYEFRSFQNQGTETKMRWNKDEDERVEDEKKINNMLMTGELTENTDFLFVCFDVSF